MVTIRLTRRGARNQPFYHVVVTDSRKRQGGASLEQVGFFNPIARSGEPKLKLDLPRIEYWVSKGAQQSDRVRPLVASYRKQASADQPDAAGAERRHRGMGGARANSAAHTASWAGCMCSPLRSRRRRFSTIPTGACAAARRAQATGSSKDGCRGAAGRAPGRDGGPGCARRCVGAMIEVRASALPPTGQARVLPGGSARVRGAQSARAWSLGGSPTSSTAPAGAMMVIRACDERRSTGFRRYREHLRKVDLAAGRIVVDWPADSA